MVWMVCIFICLLPIVLIIFLPTLDFTQQILLKNAFTPLAGMNKSYIHEHYATKSVSLQNSRNIDYTYVISNADIQTL